MTAQLSRFTPSLMPAELLESLFVGREDLLDRIMSRIGEAATSTGRNHTLLVGPRGAGKTHLVALAYHRTRALIAAGAELETSWLAEDPWRIAGYRHLLTAIWDNLDATDKGHPPLGTEHLEAALVARGRIRPVVVFIENFDQVLDHIGDTGQQRLRHLLQDRRPLLLVATTTRLNRDLSDQARPFYGFFTTTRLEPFDARTAARMLARIAEVQGEQAVADYLAGDEAKARLRVVEHLAGGQPRLWSLFGSALSIAGVRELVDLLIGRFDDLTPYYQEQLARLSPQQRLAVAELAAADRPLNVQAIAARVESSERSVAKTLSDLVDRGWIVVCDSPLLELVDGRRTYYELSEPLARIAFQLKDTRDGQPLRLVVDFLRGWFDNSDLRADGSGSRYVMEALEAVDGASTQVARRLRRLPASRRSAVDLWEQIDDGLAALRAGDPDALFRLPTPVRSAIEERLADLSAESITECRLLVHAQAGDDFGNVRHPAVQAWIDRAESLDPPSVLRPQALRCLSDWYSTDWQFDNARLVISLLAAEGDPADAERLAAQGNLAVAYQTAGRLAEAIALYQATLTDSERVLGPDHPDTLTSRNNLAGAYRSAGRLAEAIPLYQATLTDTERVLGPDHPNTLTSRNNLAGALWEDGERERAAQQFRAAADQALRVIGPDHEVTRGLRANATEAAKALLGEAKPDGERRRRARGIRAESAAD